jgi:hypothetical protein
MRILMDLDKKYGHSDDADDDDADDDDDGDDGDDDDIIMKQLSTGQSLTAVMERR